MRMQPGTPGPPPDPTTRVQPDEDLYRSRRPSPAALIALVAALVGFGCTVSTTNRQVSNGAATCSYFDLGPLAFGILTGAAGLVTLFGAVRPSRRRVIEIAIGLLALPVAAIHIMRAYGLIGGPC
jgi:hypothetical protein